VRERERETGQVSAAQRGITTGACRNNIPKHASCVYALYTAVYKLRTRRPGCFWCAPSILQHVPLDIPTLPTSLSTWTLQVIQLGYS
jgi:hypothetical protein